MAKLPPPPPPPASGNSFADILAAEHFNILYLLAILIPVFTAVIGKAHTPAVCAHLPAATNDDTVRRARACRVGSACLWRVRQRSIQEFHKAVAMADAEVGLGRSDRLHVLPSFCMEHDAVRRPLRFVS